MVVDTALDVFADADVPGWRHPISVASYHASPGDGKPECSLQVAHWLELSFGPVLLGLDANSPEIDHPDHEQSRFYWQEPPFAHCEPALIGPPSKRRHGLEDVIRTWLAGRPDESAALRAARPNGPLAISYDRHPAANQHTWSRYDSIWATSEFGVQRVEYLWDEAMGAPGGGSDHAMVVADLTRPIRPPRPPGQAIIDYLVQYEVLPDGHLLVFADRLVDEPLAAANLQRWLTERPDRGSARWCNDRARPLRWEADGNTYTAIGLAQHICNEVGIELPRRRPGPHWWVDSPTGRNLVELSE